MTFTPMEGWSPLFKVSMKNQLDSDRAETNVTCYVESKSHLVRKRLL
jgi:hypothetical protein